MVLDAEPGERDDRLILTFINNLADELKRDLGHLSRAYTFHAYCHLLLRRQPELRGALRDDFLYFPKLVHLVKADWVIVRDEEAPHFVALMRLLDRGAALDFYVDRGNYYQAVSFDDSVFRIHEALTARPESIPQYGVVLVDEYQDFNRLEISLISLLARRSRVLIAGDDDQALYSQLRGSDPAFIRELYRRAEYGVFPLPFCMRCTEVMVGAVGDIVEYATTRGHLKGRIDKPYLYYPPAKRLDSETYPRIKLVQTTIQRQGTGNYFARYIAEEIGHIPVAHIEQSRAEGFPTVLVIAADPYRWQVVDHLRLQGLTVETAEPGEPQQLERADGLRILRADPQSDLGWRIMIELDRPGNFEALVGQSVRNRTRLVEVIPPDFRYRIEEEAARWREAELPAAEQAEEEAAARPSIRATSFEGAKGLSAQHVFIVGVHDGELPRNGKAIQDLEICKLLVALTRTRKQCHILYTSHFGSVPKRASPFLRWLRDGRTERIRVDRNYWRAPF